MGPHARLSLQTPLRSWHAGLPDLGLDLGALVGEAQGGVGSLNGAGIYLAWGVEVGGAGLAPWYGPPQRTTQTYARRAEKGCGGAERGRRGVLVTLYLDGDILNADLTSLKIHQMLNKHPTLSMWKPLQYC